MTVPSSSARLTIKAGPGSGKVVELAQQEVVIGRAAPASLVIPMPDISRRHARVIFQGGNYVLEDLGSSNGTFINGQRLQQPQVLADGVEIQLGAEVFLVFSQQPSGFHAAARPSSSTGMRPFQSGPTDGTMMESGLTAGSIQASISNVPSSLQVTIAGQTTQTYTLTKDHITLGRADDNDIVVATPIMSRHHATLEKTSQGYEIRIVPGVINTLTCQGRPVTDRQLLTHADVLRIDSETPRHDGQHDLPGALPGRHETFRRPVR